MTEESLISPPPRDVLLIRRDDAIKSYKKRRVLDMVGKYQHVLSMFALDFFKGEARLSDLSEAEKKELAEICFRRSIRNLFFIFSPYVGVLALFNFFLTKTALDIFVVNFFGTLIYSVGMAVLTMIQDMRGSIKIKGYFDFIRAHLFFKKHARQEENQNG